MHIRARSLRRGPCRVGGRGRCQGFANCLPRREKRLGRFPLLCTSPCLDSCPPSLWKNSVRQGEPAGSGTEGGQPFGTKTRPRAAGADVHLWRRETVHWPRRPQRAPPRSAGTWASALHCATLGSPLLPASFLSPSVQRGHRCRCRGDWEARLGVAVTSLTASDAGTAREGPGGRMDVASAGRVCHAVGFPTSC